MMVELGVDGGVPGRCRWNPANPAKAGALGVDRMRRMRLSLMRRALRGRILEATASTAADALSSSLWEVHVMAPLGLRSQIRR